LYPLDNDTGQGEDECTTGCKGEEQEGDAPFVGEVADDLDLERIVRVRWMADFGRIGRDVEWEGHDG